MSQRCIIKGMKHPVFGEVLLNVLRCQLTYWGQVVTNAEARFNNSLRPRKPEGSLGRTAQYVHLDSHTAPELCPPPPPPPFLFLVSTE